MTHFLLETNRNIIIDILLKKYKTNLLKNLKDDDRDINSNGLKETLEDFFWEDSSYVVYFLNKYYPNIDEDVYIILNKNNINKIKLKSQNCKQVIEKYFGVYDLKRKRKYKDKNKNIIRFFANEDNEELTIVKSNQTDTLILDIYCYKDDDFKKYEYEFDNESNNFDNFNM